MPCSSDGQSGQLPKDLFDTVAVAPEPYRRLLIVVGHILHGSGARKAHKSELFSIKVSALLWGRAVDVRSVELLELGHFLEVIDEINMDFNKSRSAKVHN